MTACKWPDIFPRSQKSERHSQLRPHLRSNQERINQHDATSQRAYRVATDHCPSCDISAVNSNRMHSRNDNRKRNCTQNFQTGAVSCTYSVSGGNGPSPTKPAPQLALSDFEASPATSFTLIASAPASNFIVNRNQPAQSTITATTDTGYTASVTVDLQQVTSTTLPVNPGDAVYTWSVVNSPQLEAWTQNIEANTISTLQISGSSGLPLLPLGNPGLYTISGQINSNATGLLGIGSSAIGLAPSGPKCGSNCPVQPDQPPTN